MKAGWQRKKLGEVCIVERGSSPRPIKKYITDDGSGVNWIKIGDTKIGGRYVSQSKQKITKDGALKSRPVFKGDFILTNSMTYGRPYIMAIDGYIHDGWFVLRLSKDIDTNFFYYLLSSSVVQDQFESLSVGAVVKNISGDLVKKTQLPIPPLKEQKRIVAILDAAFEGLDRARAHTEANLQNARDLFKGQLVYLLKSKSKDWETRKLSEVCEKITDGTHQTPTYFDEGYIFLSSRNVKNKKIDWNNVKYIDEIQHIAMQKRIAPRRGDVLLAKNGTTGVAAMVDRDVIFDIYVSLAHLRALDQLEPKFLLHFVNSPLAKKQFNSRLKGQGVPNLHLKEIRDVEISFPKHRTEQNKIVAAIEEVMKATENLETRYQSKLADLEDLRQSLLQKAFAGELT